MQTLVHSNKTEDIKIKIRYDKVFTMNKDGRGGGFSFIWKGSIKGEIVLFSENITNLQIEEDIFGKWVLKGYNEFPDYGNHETC